MYVEDLFRKIRDKLTDLGLLFQPKAKPPFNGLLDDKWHHEFVESLGGYIDQNRPMSTKQGARALKIIETVRIHLVEYGWITDVAINQMLERPQFRNEPYESKYVPKEVRYLGSNLLAFRFKKNDEYRRTLKAFSSPKKHDHDYHVISVPFRYDWTHRVWIISVHRFNVLGIIEFINRERIGLDQLTADYLKLAKKSFDEPSRFFLNEDILLANVCDDPLLAGWITEVAHGIAL